MRLAGIDAVDRMGARRISAYRLRKLFLADLKMKAGRHGRRASIVLAIVASALSRSFGEFDILAMAA
jgi:hypothetical protein